MKNLIFVYIAFNFFAIFGEEHQQRRFHFLTLLIIMHHPNIPIISNISRSPTYNIITYLYQLFVRLTHKALPLY